MSAASIDPRLSRLLRLAVAVAIGELEAIRALRAEAPEGEPDRGWREVLLQAHLFAGVPRVVQAFHVLHQAGGLGTLDPDEHPVSPDERAGRELFASIYGQNTAAVRKRLETYHPSLAAWIAQHAYGDTLVRPGLAARDRELCAVASLAATGPERQLVSHTRGALALGVSVSMLKALPTVLAGLWSDADRLRYGRVLKRELAG